MKSCCTKNECAEKYGIWHCRELLREFECKPEKSGFSVYDAFPVKEYPELEGLFEK